MHSWPFLPVARVSCLGIGPKTAGILKTKGITTLFQLAGVFLTFKAAGVDEQAWCDKMWEYLETIGAFVLQGLVHARVSF